MTKTNGKEELNMNQVLSAAIQHWDYVAPIVTYPRNKKEFERLISQLDELLTMVRNNEHHHLMGLVDVLSHLVAEYEANHYPIMPSKGVEALKFLMQSHQLHQSDLTDIGSQGVISEILSGKRALNLRQIKKLCKRFHVTPETFIDA